MFIYVDALCLLPLYMYPKTHTHTQRERERERERELTPTELAGLYISTATSKYIIRRE